MPDKTTLYGPYSFASRHIVSATELSNLPRATDADQPVKFHVGKPKLVDALRSHTQWIHQWLDPLGVCLQLATLPGGDTETNELYLLRAPGLCDFRLDLIGGHIEIDRTVRADWATIEHLLIDQVLPRLLSGQNELVLHAACVTSGDCGAIFLGESGWGKSTLTSLLIQSNCQALTDDCLVLERSGPSILATATYPSLRLFQDSIDATLPSPPTVTSIVAAYTGKRRIHSHQSTGTAKRPIQAAYVLNDPQINPVSRTLIEPIQSANLCVALVRHGFRLDIHARDKTTNQFEQATGISKQLSGFKFSYPRTFESSQRTIEALLLHLKSVA